MVQSRNAICIQNQYFSDAILNLNYEFNSRRTFSMINPIARTTDITLLDGGTYTIFYNNPNNY